jgi:hypothetical protein
MIFTRDPGVEFKLSFKIALGYTASEFSRWRWWKGFWLTELAIIIEWHTPYIISKARTAELTRDKITHGRCRYFENRRKIWLNVTISIHHRNKWIEMLFIHDSYYSGVLYRIRKLHKDNFNLFLVVGAPRSFKLLQTEYEWQGMGSGLRIQGIVITKLRRLATQRC